MTNPLNFLYCFEGLQVHTSDSSEAVTGTSGRLCCVVKQQHTVRQSRGLVQQLSWSCGEGLWLSLPAIKASVCLSKLEVK